MKFDNAPCHCGSPKKYKHCHMRLEALSKVSWGELSAIYGDWPVLPCMHHEAKPECERSIKAHSVSRTAALEPISSEGHVYTYFPFLGFDKEEAVPRRVGLNKASVFSGMCLKHDTAAFATADVNATSGLGFAQGVYRSLLYEKYKKLCGLKRLPRALQMMQQGCGYPKQLELARRTSIQRAGLESGCRIIARLADRAVSAMASGADLPGFSIRVPSPPLLAMASTFSPEFNLLGKRMQSLAFDQEDDVAYIAASMMYVDGHSYITYGSVSHATWVRAYLHELMDEFMRNSYTAVELAFYYCENVYFSKSFRDRLIGQEGKRVLQLATEFNANMIPFRPAKDNPMAQLIGTPEVIYRAL